MFGRQSSSRATPGGARVRGAGKVETIKEQLFQHCGHFNIMVEIIVLILYNYSIKS